MKEEEIFELERQLALLEKEARALGEAYNQRDEKKFAEAKKNMLNAQKTIKWLIK